MHTQELAKSVYDGFSTDVKALYGILRDHTHPQATEAEIQYLIGCQILERNQSSQDAVEAAQLFTLAAKENHAKAQYALAIMICKGQGGLLKNHQEINRLLCSSARQGNTEAKSMLMQIVASHQNSKNTSSIVPLQPKYEADAADTPLCIAVVAGNVEAVKALLQAKARMQGPLDLALKGAREKNTPEHTEIVRLLEAYLLSSAEQENIESQLMLANVYFMKEDEKNYVEARKWFEKAADLGNPQAKYRLAMMINQGQGRARDPRDQAEFKRLIDEAAEGGDKNARYLLEKIAIRLPRIENEQKKPALQDLIGSSIKYLEKSNNQATTQPKSKPKCETRKDTENLTKKPGQKQTSDPAQTTAQRGKSADQNTQKKVPSKTLFSEALREKRDAILKIRFAMGSCSGEKTILKQEIFKKIAVSSGTIFETRLVPKKDKSRSHKLSQNLDILTAIENLDKKIEKQKEIIHQLMSNFSDLSDGLQAALDLKPEESVQLSPNTQQPENSESTFKWTEFLQQLIAQSEALEVSKFEKALQALQKEWDVVIKADEELSTLMFELRRYNTNETGVLAVQQKAWLALVHGFKDASGNTVQADTNTKICAVLIKMVEKFTNLGTFDLATMIQKLIKPDVSEEKTAQEPIAQSGLTIEGSASQQSSNNNNNFQRDNPNATGVTTVVIPIPESKGTAELLYVSRASRRQKKRENWITEQSRKKREQQADAITQRLAAFEAGCEVYSRPDIKVQEEKMAEEQNFLLTKGLVDIDREIKKMKSIISVIKKKNELTLTQAEKYAILQNFASINVLVKNQYWDGSIREVAKYRRHAVYKDHEKVLKAIFPHENLLIMVNALIQFLEKNENCVANENAALNKEGSPLLSAVYGIGKQLTRDIDVQKSMRLVREMMTFKHNQKYELGCNLRLISNHVKNFLHLIERGHEIVISQDGDQFFIYYKNKNTCKTEKLMCQESLKTVLSSLLEAGLVFNSKKLVRREDCEELYQEVYKTVALQQGCTSSGEDIIGEQANKFCDAIAGSELKSLWQIRDDKSHTDHATVCEFLRGKTIRLFVKERIDRGVFVRHAGETKSDDGISAALLFGNPQIKMGTARGGGNKRITKQHTGEPLLFTRTLEAVTTTSLANLADAANHPPVHAANTLVNLPLALSKEPAVTLVVSEARSMAPAISKVNNNQGLGH